jgi:hypothetical protein
MISAEPESTQTSLSSVLANLGAELNALTSELDRLEHTILSMVQTSHPQDATLIHQLQAVDLISQSLRALSAFSQGLARSVPHTCRVDIAAAIQGITLSRLSSRLDTSKGLVDPPRPGAFNELDLF